MIKSSKNQRDPKLLAAYGDIFRDNSTNELVEVLRPGPPSVIFYMNKEGFILSTSPPTFANNFTLVISVQDRPGSDIPIYDNYGYAVNPSRPSLIRRLVSTILSHFKEPEKGMRPWVAQEPSFQTEYFRTK